MCRVRYFIPHFVLVYLRLQCVRTNLGEYPSHFEETVRTPSNASGHGYPGIVFEPPCEIAARGPFHSKACHLPKQPRQAVRRFLKTLSLVPFFFSYDRSARE